MSIKSTFKNLNPMQGDMVVWMIFLLLCMISITEVYSASSRMTYATGQYWEPIIKHTAFVCIGIVITWVIHLLPCNVFKAACTLMLHFVAYPLLLWALFFSAKTNDGGRWIHILGGYTIQPSELAKICLIGFVAFILATLRDEKGASRTAVKIVSVEVAAVLALIITENLSTAILIGTVMFLLCWIAQVSHKFLLWVGGIVCIAGISGILLAYSIPKETLKLWASDEYKETPLHRVPTWVNRITQKEVLPEDPRDYEITDQNAQVTHARIAVATCNVIGKGPGNSVQRDYLPQAFSDFIYAIIIEEGGLASGGAVMFLYLLLMWRAYNIAGKCRTRFPAYLVMGLTLMIVAQAMINMAVSVKAMPTTGQTLPLISKGGTSTFVSCAYIGMILSVSRSAKRIDDKKEEEKTEKTEA